MPFLHGTNLSISHVKSITATIELSWHDIKTCVGSNYRFNIQTLTIFSWHILLKNKMTIPCQNLLSWIYVFHTAHFVTINSQKMHEMEIECNKYSYKCINKSYARIEIKFLIELIN